MPASIHAFVLLYTVSPVTADQSSSSSSEPHVYRQ